MISSIVCSISSKYASHLNWSKYYCYKHAPSRYDLRCLKASLNPNKQILI